MQVKGNLESILKRGSITGYSTTKQCSGQIKPSSQWVKTGWFEPQENVLDLFNKSPDATTSLLILDLVGEKKMKLTNIKLCFSLLN